MTANKHSAWVLNLWDWIMILALISLLIGASDLRVSEDSLKIHRLSKERREQVCRPTPWERLHYRVLWRLWWFSGRKCGEEVLREKVEVCSRNSQRLMLNYNKPVSQRVAWLADQLFLHTILMAVPRGRNGCNKEALWVWARTQNNRKSFFWFVMVIKTLREWGLK